MKQYEYMLQGERLTEQTLNNLGSQGWDLISSQIFQYDGFLRFHYVFKREK